MLKKFVAGLIALLVVAGWISGGAPSAQAAVKSLSGCGANSIAANDDDSSSLVTLPFNIDFFGTNYGALYVNNNGNVTFSGPQSTFTPFGLLDTSTVIIAPFFGDVDTRGPGSGLVTYGATTFNNRPAFCANWVNVGYYNSATDKTNSFQLLLVDRSDVGVGDFDIVFNYDQIQWETGDASGGTNGLGGSSARAGYSNGIDTAFELPGSGVNGAFLDGGSNSLAQNSRNSTTAGRHIFAVRSGVAPTGGFVSGVVTGDRGDGINEPLEGAAVQVCRQDVVPAQCSTTFTNANGEYSVAGLAAGTYNGVVGPPASRPDLFPRVNDLFDLGNNQGRTDYNFKLLLPRPIPQGVRIDGMSQTSGGSPVLNWNTTTQIYTTNPDCSGGSGTWELIQAGETIASGTMSATATDGEFKGTIPVLRPAHGVAVLHIEMSCPGAGEDKVLDIDTYIDPSGTVLNSNDMSPVAGATVTLLRADTSAGPFDPVPDGSSVMDPSNRANPDLTDADGVFHWEVTPGFYKVRAEKAGCSSPTGPESFVETDVLEVPPPAFNLVLELDCGGGGPVPTNTPVGPTNTPTSPTATPQGQFGDANCNGTVNAIDAAIILQYTAGLVGSLPCAGLADVNENGNIDSIDSAIILQYTAGLINSLPV